MLLFFFSFSKLSILFKQFLLISVSVISFDKRYTHKSFRIIKCFCIFCRQRKYGSSTVQRSYTRISRISCLIYSLGKLKMDVHIHNTYFFIVNIVHIIHIQLITPGTTFFRRKIWS